VNVRDVIAGKASQTILSVNQQAAMSDVVGSLVRHGIGALVVSSDTSELVGIVSERDVVRALSVDGRDCLQRSVSQYMTRDVQCATPEDSIDSVLAVMTERRFRHMPVLKEGRLVGVISIGDAVKARIEGLERENEALSEWIKSG